jgi:HSP20 family protein
MSNSVKKMPEHPDEKASQHPVATDLWRPLEKLRQQVDHLFDDFNRGSSLSPFGRGLFDVEPFWKRELTGHGMPAVDISEKEKASKSPPSYPAWIRRTLRSNCRTAI